MADPIFRALRRMIGMPPNPQEEAALAAAAGHNNGYLPSWGQRVGFAHGDDYFMLRSRRQYHNRSNGDSGRNDDGSRANNRGGNGPPTRDLAAKPGPKAVASTISNRSLSSHLEMYERRRKAGPGADVLTGVNYDDEEVNRRTGHVAVRYRNLAFVWGGCCSEKVLATPDPDGGGVFQNRYYYWRPDWIMIHDFAHRTWLARRTNGRIPAALSGSAAAVHGHHMYVFGGYGIVNLNLDESDPEEDRIRHPLLLKYVDDDSVGRYSRVLYRLNLKTLTWDIPETEGLPPFASDKLKCFATDGKVFFFGGYGPEPTDLDDEAMEVPDHTEWVEDVSLQQSNGLPRGWNNQLVVYDVRTSRWAWPEVSGTPPLPRAVPDLTPSSISLDQDEDSDEYVSRGGGRYDQEDRGQRSSASTSGGCTGAYLFGGRFGQYRLNDLYHLDLSSQPYTWTQIHRHYDDSLIRAIAMPKGRSWHSLNTLADGRLFLYGGYDNYEKALHDCWIFDPKAPAADTATGRQWTRVRHLEFPRSGRRFWHCAVNVPDGNGVMIVGGFISQAVLGSNLQHPDKVLSHYFSPKSLKGIVMDWLLAERHQRFVKFGSDYNDEELSKVLPADLMRDLTLSQPKFNFDKSWDYCNSLMDLTNEACS